MKKTISLSALILFFSHAFLLAGEADIVDARVEKSSENSYQFVVTVSHQDTGWEHYANKWDVLDETGKTLGTRTLYHPHVNEQPFTRSLSGVIIPDDVKKVIIRVHDSKHGYGGKTMTISLP